MSPTRSPTRSSSSPWPLPICTARLSASAMIDPGHWLPKIRPTRLTGRKSVCLSIERKPATDHPARERPNRTSTPAACNVARIVTYAVLMDRPRPARRGHRRPLVDVDGHRHAPGAGRGCAKGARDDQCRQRHHRDARQPSRRSCRLARRFPSRRAAGAAGPRLAMDRHAVAAAARAQGAGQCVSAAQAPAGRARHAAMFLLSWASSPCSPISGPFSKP